MNPYLRSASIWGGIVHVHMILGHAAQAAGDARIAFHYARLALAYQWAADQAMRGA